MIDQREKNFEISKTWKFLAILILFQIVKFYKCVNLFNLKN